LRLTALIARLDFEAKTYKSAKIVSALGGQKNMDNQYRRGGNQQSAPVEKPYRYIATTDPRRALPQTHERYGQTLTGKMKGFIRTLAPLHVGSGILDRSERLFVSNEDIEDFPLAKAFVMTSFGSSKYRIVPSTSLKGAVRSVVETLTDSCICKVKSNNRDSVPQNRRECEFKPNRNRKELCPACRIFGALGYLGKVRFSDAEQARDEGVVIPTGQLYEPGKRPNAAPDRKFYPHHATTSEGEQPVEAVPENEEFNFSVRFENMLPVEMGALGLALGQVEPRLRLKLGGFKPLGFGTVEFVIEKLRLENDRALYFDYDADSEEVANPAEKFAEWAKAATGGANPLVAKEKLEKLSQILRFPTNLQPPEGGVY
jgi:CRISPR/Cas system CSM-associated protein Csm3 (group 7 of RAMP superfamily)